MLFNCRAVLKVDLQVSPFPTSNAVDSCGAINFIDSLPKDKLLREKRQEKPKEHNNIRGFKMISFAFKVHGENYSTQQFPSSRDNTTAFIHAQRFGGTASASLQQPALNINFTRSSSTSTWWTAILLRYRALCPSHTDDYPTKCPENSLRLAEKFASV